MRLSRLALLLVFALPLAAHARETPAEHAANVYATQEIATAPPNGNMPDFSLPNAKLTQAHHLMTLDATLHFCVMAWSIVQLILLLHFGIIGWMRDRAIATSQNRWIQVYVFLFLLLATRTLCFLPFNIAYHWIGLAYKFSIQSWSSWLVDLAKSFTLNWLGIGLLAMLLFWLIGSFPRRWWLIFAGAMVPITFALLYLSPIFIDPLFNKFEPLVLHHPQLSAELEHMGVPPDHQFLMFASAKVTTPNAYVTGVAGSKRVVVWDTSIDPSKPVSPETLWLVGHECGHYVLNHVLIGVWIGIISLPLILYLVFRFLQAMLARYGARWRIPSQQDLGAIAILLLAYALINLVQEPFSNGISRHIEHNADTYGQEAIHGLVPDPQAAVKNSMDTMGEQGLNDPNPNRFLIFWTFTHPSTGYRAAFGKAYDPWAPGMEPKYFKPDSRQ